MEWEETFVNYISETGLISKIQMELLQLHSKGKKKNQKKDKMPKQAFIQKGFFAIYYNLDDPGGHYAQQNNQTQKDKYGIISLICWNLKNVNSQSRETERWLPGSGG